MENQGEIILYQPDSEVKLEVRLEEETVWLTQAQMAELFQTTRNNVTLHIRNIFKEGLNWSKIQYVRNPYVLPLTVKNTAQTFTTLM